MSGNSNNSGILTINVRAWDQRKPASFEESIPKNIQILSADLNIERSFWIFSDSWTDSLRAGVYLIRIKITSTKEIEKIIEILPQKENIIDFDIREERERREILNYSSYDTKYYRTFSKPRRGSDDYYKEIVIIDWIHNEGKFSINENRRYFPRFLPINSTILSEREKMHISELHLSSSKSVFVCLPPVSELSIIKNSTDILTNLKISIDIPNKSAQTLLYLMNKGDADKAETLFDVRQAEILLYEKKRDPVSAAIGGYFLLSTGQLEFMHHWPNNLANWFEWLPDGPIIHAWQLIKSRDLNIPMIQERLLEAVSRGIPLFTEGLRLLYEGLTLLYQHYHHESFVVEQALDKVKIYMETADLSKPFTTLIGKSDLLIKISET